MPVTPAAGGQTPAFVVLFEGTGSVLPPVRTAYWRVVSHQAFQGATLTPSNQALTCVFLFHTVSGLHAFQDPLEHFICILYNNLNIFLMQFKIRQYLTFFPKEKKKETLDYINFYHSIPNCMKLLPRFYCKSLILPLKTVNLFSDI